VKAGYPVVSYQVLDLGTLVEQDEEEEDNEVTEVEEGDTLHDLEDLLDSTVVQGVVDPVRQGVGGPLEKKLADLHYYQNCFDFLDHSKTIRHNFYYNITFRNTYYIFGTYLKFL